VILDAEQKEALQTIGRAERIFSSARNGDDESLKEEFQLQQLFNKAYAVLEQNEPERLRRLEVRMIRFEEELKQAGVDTEELAPPSSTFDVFVRIVKQSMKFVLMIGPATVGTILHFPAYRLGGYLATKLSKNSDDVISTIKIISAMLLFPLTWLAVAIACYALFGWIGSVVALLGIPLCGYVAILFYEELDTSLGGIRVLLFFLMRRRFFVRLLAERNAIRNEILALGRERAITRD
jgi:hypothetical protein